MASVEQLRDLLAKVRERTPGLLATLEGRYVAVGDLHGDYKTLQLLLKEWEGPYLFLGDYVDRGDEGLEVVTEVFRLFVEGKALPLRGNHESPMMNVDGGFLDELCDKVGRGKCGVVYREFEKTFAKLPVAAVVNGRFVALHGGIPLRDDMTPATLEDIKNASGDLNLPSDSTLFQTLWNDPCNCEDYAPSPRGPGAWLFGRKITQAFHKTHGTSAVVRGHTYVPEGCARHHGDAVVTIFTSSAGPYRKTKPKIAIVDKQLEVIDLATKQTAKCPQDPALFF
ncbi:MAG: metallophosphoesterase family protein [Pyrobaculum sp.]|jgi:protein phosphatase